MDDNSKHPLQQVFELMEAEPRAYSGRAMYGQRCLAIVTDINVGEVFGRVLETMTEQKIIHEDPHQCNVIAEAFRGMRTDSMGRDIVIYFPDIQFVDD